MPRDATSHIKSFWEDRAQDADLLKDRVTHPDFNQRFLENEVLLQYLPLGQRILDVGCGNGFSTALFSRFAKEIIGIDYSAGMIERAKREFSEIPNVDFRVGDVLDLQFESNSFEVVISQRCLINLPTWEEQQKALANIADVLKPQGYFFLQEGTQQGRENLNQARELLGLKRMGPVRYNLDFDENLLWPYLRQYFIIVDVRRFGLYDLISRLVHPLLVAPEEPKYDAKINEIARQLSTKLAGVDDLSREFSAVLRRLDR